MHKQQQGEKVFEKKVTDDIAKIFPRAESILNQKEEEVSHVGEVTYLEKLEDITKLDIKSIDDSLRIEETPKERTIFRDPENKVFNSLNASVALT